MKTSLPSPLLPSTSLNNAIIDLYIEHGEAGEKFYRYMAIKESMISYDGARFLTLKAMETPLDDRISVLPIVLSAEDVCLLFKNELRGYRLAVV